MTRHPPPRNTQNGDNRVDGDEEYPAFFNIESSSLLKEVRQPDEEKPPDRIGNQLGDNESPRLPIPQELTPWYFRTAFGNSRHLITANQR